MKTQKPKRRPAKDSLTYYRLKNADGLYWNVGPSEAGWRPVAEATLFSTRPTGWGKYVEPVRVTPLRGKRANPHRTR